jgi:hypothetical protein
MRLFPCKFDGLNQRKDWPASAVAVASGYEQGNYFIKLK